MIRIVMRNVLGATLLLAGLAAQPVRAEPPQPGIADDAARLAALQNEITAYLRRSGGGDPWGVPKADDSRADSLELHGWLVRLDAMDSAHIADPELARTLPRTADWVRATLADRNCRDELRNVDQLFGFQVQAGLAFATRPLGTPPARASLLRDAARLPEAVRRQIMNLREGSRLGFAAPRNNVERVMAQLDGMRLDARDSALYAPLARDTSAEFARQWRAMIADSVAPAMAAYRAFLANTYLPLARSEPALAALPGGRACYAAKVALTAGMTSDVDALYDASVRGRLALMPELRTVASQLFGDSVPLIDALRRIRTELRFVMQNPDSILAAYTDVLARAHTRIAPLFTRMPEAPLAIRAIPASQAASQAPARFQPAARDGSAPAVFYVNAYQPGGVARMNIALGAAHEGYPGHHFQFMYSALAGASRALPPFLTGGAYIEGWGIYAERLGDEVGLYTEPVDRLGYLVHLLDVYVGLQGDIGMHARGWTRAAVIDTMMAVAGRPRAQAESYADRHAATPAQLASYGIGFLTIVDARSAAERQLGRRFDEPAFHDVVLAGGGSLPELRARVDSWVRKRLAEGAPAP